MPEHYGNSGKIARTHAGMTQERWAASLDRSPESVRLYESGRGMPSDDVVTRMIEVSSMPVLGYWHLLNKSRVAADILPEVPACSLPQAVIQLICRIRDFGERHRTDSLMDIAADGRIDDTERELFTSIVAELDSVVQAAMTVKYAKGD